MFNGKYFEWNQKRIKAIVDFYGHKFFYMKKILDLGCGHGDLGGVLYRLGADVTGVDARQEHLKMVSKKFSGIKVIKADLDKEWPFSRQKFDLVLDLGLICHLNNYEDHIKKACSSTTHLVIETAVCDSTDTQKFISVDEDKTHYDLAYNGKGCLPSSAAIERVLKECGMNFKRMDNSKLNTPEYQYDWRPSNDGSSNVFKRKMWFCVKETSLVQFAIPLAPKAPVFVPAPIIPPVFAPSEYKSSAKISTNYCKTRLFYNYYEEKNNTRKLEIDLCLQKNINNPLFDIIILDSQDRPTYDFFFEKINRLAGADDISIFCNSDVFFDDTIISAQKIGSKEVYALSSWSWNGQNNSSLPTKENSQDAWIVRGKIENVFGDFPMGLNKSNERLAHEFSKAGYTLINPSKTIKATHVHNSNVRNYTENDVVPGPYLSVPIIGF